MPRLDPRALQVAESLVSTFAGRRDAYNRWTGRGYVTVREPLTAEVAVEAIRRRRPVGAYVLGPDSCSHVGALDVDRSDGWELARRVGTRLWTVGIPAYVERSRGGRAHLWIVLGLDPSTVRATLPGVVLRFALNAVLQASGMADRPGIELRPGADRLSGPDGLGHALRLPTMPHPISGERHPLSDPRSGDPIGSTLGDMIIALEFAPPDRVTELAERYRPPSTAPWPAMPRTALFRGTGPIARFNGAVGVSAVLGREFNVQNATPGRTIRCPVHADRRPSLSIARDDARVWCHAPGCELHGPNGAGHDAYGLWALAKARTP